MFSKCTSLSAQLLIFAVSPVGERLCQLVHVHAKNSSVTLRGVGLGLKDPPSLGAAAGLVARSSGCGAGALRSRLSSVTCYVQLRGGYCHGPRL